MSDSNTAVDGEENDPADEADSTEADLLEDETDDATDDGAGDPAGADDDRIDYEVAGWSGQSRALLDSMLTTEGVAHVWQGTQLTVGAADEELVDSLIDTVTATATNGLDPDRVQVLYEVGTWSAAMQTSLAQALDVAEIPFEWDENGDLKIYEDDEDQVDEILDGMPDPDDPDAVDADGVDVQAVFSQLWEATGSLARRPNDAEAVLVVVAAAAEMERMSLPFGFEPAVWRRLMGRVSSLRAALESDDPEVQLTDDEIGEVADDVYNELRHYI